MSTVWWNGAPPATKFAQNFKVPLYSAKDGSPILIKQLTDYVLMLEDTIINNEELVSPVPKPLEDPYQHTQHWKQHNLLDDVVGLGGEHIIRFPKNPAIEELFTLIRTHYLTHIANLNYPRIKTYIHGWANILRNGQWISKHCHISNDQSYLASTYYLTTTPTNLILEDPADSNNQRAVLTEARRLVFWPSWVPHYSDVYKGSELRISLAFDIVTESCVEKNPWRPHRLLDDPATMPGIDSIIKSSQ